MNRLLVFGLGATGTALAALVALEAVEMAEARGEVRPQYIAAISSGPALVIRRPGDSSADVHARQFTCSRLLAVGEVRLGLHCQQAANRAY